MGPGDRWIAYRHARRSRRAGLLTGIGVRRGAGHRVDLGVVFFFSCISVPSTARALSSVWIMSSKTVLSVSRPSASASSLSCGGGGLQPS
jgi:hypothetical protein